MNNLQRLWNEHRQSPWIDFIDRALIDSGQLREHVDSGIRGLTSNPTIFARAVASGQYDALIRRAVAAGKDPRAIYQDIVVNDIRDAADVLRPVYDAADGADGFASIEVEPDLADDTEGTVNRARELWSLVGRPNVFVKIPATPAGLPAIERGIAEGININVTLLFSVDVYRDVARAYLDGLRRRLGRGEDITRVASVASFFVSRVDTKADEKLGAIGTPAALAARGKAAIANAKQAYRAYGEIFGGPEFVLLREAGARVQRCLWASTSTKNPAYRDVRYVESLIGPDTVDTLPPDTIEAFVEHGELARTLDADLGAAEAALAEVEAQGVRISRVTDELTVEGVAAFARSFDELLATIEAKGRSLVRA